MLITPYLPILLSPALIPSSPGQHPTGSAAIPEALLSSRSLAVVLRQTSDWLGSGYMLISEPITEAGGMQSPDWLTLGHVPSYISQLPSSYPDRVWG